MNDHFFKGFHDRAQELEKTAIIASGIKVLAKPILSAGRYLGRRLFGSGALGVGMGALTAADTISSAHQATKYYDAGLKAARVNRAAGASV